MHVHAKSQLHNLSVFVIHCTHKTMQREKFEHILSKLCIFISDKYLICLIHGICMIYEHIINLSVFR